MPTPKLNAELRDKSVKEKAHKLRQKGFIPGVLYGHNKDTRQVQLKTKELLKLISQYGRGTMINIELNKEVIPVIIKEVQKATTTSKVLHVDFQQLDENEKVKLTVSINVVNKELVENSATIVEQQLKEIMIQCLPKHIPTSVTIDASKLNEGTIKVKDLDIANNDNVEILNNNEEDIVASLTYASKEEILEEDNAPIYESSKSVLDN